MLHETQGAFFQRISAGGPRRVQSGSTRKVTLLNPKGGCGKTTIATNLASYYALQGYQSALVDYDGQGSSSRWLARRSPEAPPIHSVAAYRKTPGITRSWQLRVPTGTQRVVVDTSAGVRGPELRELIRDTNVVVVPVASSPLDIDAAFAFLDELLFVPKVRSGEIRVGIVANRLRGHRDESQVLEQFLGSLRLPLVAKLRDSELYSSAAMHGIGIHELHPNHVDVDEGGWLSLLRWIESDSSLTTAEPRQVSTDSHNKLRPVSVNGEH